MNFEITIKTKKDGRFEACCSALPGTTGEGSTAEEAAEQIIEKIANVVSQNIKKTLRQMFKQAAKNPKRRPRGAAVMAQIPMSLN